MNCFFVGEGFAEVVVGGGTDLLKAFFYPCRVVHG